MTTQIELSKLVTYAILKPVDERVSKLVTYAVIAPGFASLSKLLTYAILVPPTYAPASGAIVFTGFAPTAAFSLAVAPPAGAIVFTGHSPSDDVIALPATGAIVFVGFAPTLINGSNAPPFFFRSAMI